MNFVTIPSGEWEPPEQSKGTSEFIDQFVSNDDVARLVRNVKPD